MQYYLVGILWAWHARQAVVYPTRVNNSCYKMIRSVWIVPTSRYKMMCMIPDTIQPLWVGGVGYPNLREWYPSSHRQMTVDVKFFITVSECGRCNYVLTCARDMIRVASSAVQFCQFVGQVNSRMRSPMMRSKAVLFLSKTVLLSQCPIKMTNLQQPGILQQWHRLIYDWS